MAHAPSIKLELELTDILCDFAEQAIKAEHDPKERTGYKTAKTQLTLLMQIARLEGKKEGLKEGAQIALNGFRRLDDIL